jgi:hypothetical protein
MERRMSAFHLCTKHLLRLAALALAVQMCAPLQAAHAQDVAATQSQPAIPCALPAGKWGCFGMIEMRPDGKAVRLTQFSNGDMLMEIEQDGRTKRLLIAMSTHSERYFGLTESELTLGRIPGSEISTLRNPFLFFTDAFAGPIMALHLGFPDGPSSVPSSATTRHVALWGKPGDITAQSLSATRVSYRLEMNGHGFSGDYNEKRPEPLRDSDIASWGPAQQMQTVPAPVAKRP